MSEKRLLKEMLFVKPHAKQVRMTWRQIKQAVLSNKHYFESNTLKDTWSNAIYAADIDRVEWLINERKFSPDFQVEEDSQIHPLTTILLYDHHPDIFEQQTELVKFLIDKGCDLKSPDDFDMIPADYAMISGNAKAAEEVVRRTIIEDGRMEYERRHIPSVYDYFMTVEDRGLRLRSYNMFMRNHKYISQTFQKALQNESDPELAEHISEGQKAYWHKPLKAKFKDMPHPAMLYY